MNLVNEFFLSAQKNGFEINVINDATYKTRHFFDSIMNYTRFFSKLHQNDRVILLLDGSPESAALLVSSLRVGLKCHVYGSNIGKLDLEKEVQLLKPTFIVFPTYKQMYFQNWLSQPFDSNRINYYFAVKLNETRGDIFDSKHYNLVARTSGSTGSPKYLAFSLETKFRRLSNFQSVYGIDKSELVVISSSFHQTLAIRNILNAMHGGLKTLLCWPFNPDSIYSIGTENHAFLTLVPAQIKKLLTSNRLQKSDNFRLLSSSSYLTIQEKKQVLSLLTSNFYECYGTAELAICTSIKHRLDSLELLNSVGFEVPDCKIKLVESNQTKSGWLITVKSNQTVDYIFDDNLRFYQPNDGDYLNTGDLGRKQENFSLLLLGRDKELIDVGGSKVYPIEIENIASKITGVVSCLAFPSQHAVLGEVVGLAVVSSENLESRDIIAFFIDKVESYKIPHHVIFIDQIPLTAAGKPDRSVLAERVN